MQQLWQISTITQSDQSNCTRPAPEHRWHIAVSGHQLNLRKDWIAYSLKPPVLQLPKMARFPKRQGRWCQRFALLRKSRRCCLPEFQTQAVTEACGTGLTHRAQRNWEGSMIDDFSRGWSHSCKPRRSCLLYLCFILRVQNNAASLIDFNMAAGGQQDCSRKSAASLKWIWRKANSCWAYTPLDNLPDYVHRGDEPVQPVCVCVRVKSYNPYIHPQKTITRSLYFHIHQPSTTYITTRPKQHLQKTIFQ